MGIGERIKIARTRLKPKLTQKAIAEKLGIEEQAVSGWERGGRPDMEHMPELRKMLRVTYTWLHEGSGPPPAPDDPQVLLDDAQAEVYRTRVSIRNRNRP